MEEECFKNPPHRRGQTKFFIPEIPFLGIILHNTNSSAVKKK
jgi:hypothetical protein